MRRNKHLRTVYKPLIRGILTLPRDVLLRILSFVGECDRHALCMVHSIFRLARTEIQRVRELVDVQGRLDRFRNAQTVRLANLPDEEYEAAQRDAYKEQEAERVKVHAEADASFAQALRP